METFGTLRLMDIRCAEQVWTCVNDLTAPYREDVAVTALSCSKNNVIGVLVSVNATAEAKHVADAIGGMIYVASLVYRELRLPRNDFRCAGRENGKLKEGACRCRFADGAVKQHANVRALSLPLRSVAAVSVGP